MFEKLYDSFTRLEADSDIIYKDPSLHASLQGLLNRPFGKIQSPQLSNN